MNPDKSKRSKSRPWGDHPAIEVVDRSRVQATSEDGAYWMAAMLYEVDGRWRVHSLQIDADPLEGTRAVTGELLTTAPLARVEAAANADELLPQHLYPSRRTKLVVPKVVPYPEDFWIAVAHRYTDYVILRGYRNPAVAIAEDAGVPVPTVRGWIAKCRTLGLIAKGKQGRPG
jgi:hypothetical protein